MKIEGSVALVTGASSGIGEATAERLAMAGYKVYGTSRRGAQAGRRSFEMLPLDVTSDESVEAVVKDVRRLDGRIDLLVNNATRASSRLALPCASRARRGRPPRAGTRSPGRWRS
jgi:NAD(P)-dependent dehydrogenase (short-subunit alcohol dehydrogenase family)